MTKEIRNENSILQPNGWDWVKYILFAVLFFALLSWVSKEQKEFKELENEVTEAILQDNGIYTD